MHYNYLRPHTSLNGKTPAEAAGIDFPYKNWADVTRHKPSKPIITEHQPRTALRLEPTHVGRPKKRVRVSPRTRRITPSTPPISKKLNRILDASGGIEINKRTGRGHIKLW